MRGSYYPRQVSHMSGIDGFALGQPAQAPSRGAEVSHMGGIQGFGMAS